MLSGFSGRSLVRFLSGTVLLKLFALAAVVIAIFICIQKFWG